MKGKWRPVLDDQKNKGTPFTPRTRDNKQTNKQIKKTKFTKSFLEETTVAALHMI